MTEKRIGNNTKGNNIPTFADEFAVGAHKVQPPVMLKIDCLVLGKLVDAQMFNHSIELLLCRVSTEESGNLLNFPSQILATYNLGNKHRFINIMQ